MVGLVCGDDMAALGITNAMFVIAVPPPRARPVPQGSAVITRRRRGELTEQTLRVLDRDDEGEMLDTAPLDRPPQRIRHCPGETKIIGVVQQPVNVF